MRGFGGRRRRFGRRRVRFSKQYRTWEMFFTDAEAVGLAGLPVRQLIINSNNAVLTDFPDIGGSVPTFGTQTVAQNLTGQFGLTAVVPLVNNTHFAEHGNEFTIRALHGYAFPQSAQTFDQAATLGTAGTALCRLALGEMEFAADQYAVSDDATAAGNVFNMGLRPFQSIWSRQGLKRRIWWQRTFYCGLNQANPFQFQATNTGGHSFVDGPCLERGGFSFHLPRYNFRVRKGRTLPVLFYGYGGGAGSNLTESLVSTHFHQLAGSSAFILNASLFARGFITR